MHKGYGSCLVCLSVRPSVCLSVPTLAALAYACTCNQRYAREWAKFTIAVGTPRLSRWTTSTQCCGETTEWSLSCRPMLSLSNTHLCCGDYRMGAELTSLAPKRTTCTWEGWTKTTSCGSTIMYVTTTGTYSGSCLRCVWQTHTSCTNTTLVPQDNL